MTLTFLENIGLTPKEAGLYELLLKLGEVPAQAIIKESKLKRATAYKVLYSLEQKGLVSKKDIQKKIHFRPEQPNKLLDLAENQYQSLERAKGDLQTILPQLTSEYILSVEKPVVATLEGISGIKKVYEELYAPKTEPVYGCADVEKIEQAIPGLVLKDIVPNRLKNKVFSKAFLASSPATKKLAKNDAKQLRETVLLDKEKYPIPAEIDIYGDKVALLSFASGQFAGIIIQNKDIAASLKSIFKLAFEREKTKPPKIAPQSGPDSAH